VTLVLFAELPFLGPRFWCFGRWRKVALSGAMNSLTAGDYTWAILPKGTGFVTKIAKALFKDSIRSIRCASGDLVESALYFKCEMTKNHQVRFQHALLGCDALATLQRLRASECIHDHR
jgi:hypothetical protein